jgi:diacylglycerol kinase family enzyme
MAASRAGHHVAERRLLLLANPRASGISSGLCDAVVTTLMGAFAVDVVESESPERATEASRRAAAEGFEVVAALGGDGAFRSAAEGIVETGTALAPIPAGSRNVFARIVGVPADPRKAARVLAAGDLALRRVDVGVIADRRFLFTASVGLSARINEQVNRRPLLKRRVGALYGVGAGVMTAAAYLFRPPRMRLRAGARERSAISMVVQNAPALTYVGARPVELCRQVRHGGGTVSIAALRSLRPTDLATIPARLLRSGGTPAIAHSRIEELDGVVEAEVRSASGRELPIDVDGDPAGSFERFRVGVLHRALAVLGGRPAPAVEEPG